MRPHRFAPVVGAVSAALFAVAGLPACDDQTAITDPGPGAAEPTKVVDETPDGSLPPPVYPSELEVQRELMARWNAVATVADQPFDLYWTVFEQFPHPTYKGGSAPAYRAFAAVLLAFFQTADNFDFLARNHLFTLHLTYVFPNGASGLDTTFQALAAAFAAPDGFGDIPLEVRTALQGIGDRIQAVVSGAVPAQPADGGVADYATMCRHYCEALDETVIYACVERTGDANACAQSTPTADQCYELRCATMQIEPSLCLTQCDSLRAAYDAVCADGPGPAELCAASSEDHDRTCRAGCAGPS